MAEPTDPPVTLATLEGTGGAMGKSSGEGLAALAQRLLRAYPGRRDEALGALNGAVGDRLATHGSRLAVPMRLYELPEPTRDDPSPLPRLLESPPVAVPGAGPAACLFVHGLMGSQLAWRFGVGRDRGDERVDIPASMARDHGLTPILVGYNTGRHISENGRELAHLLEHLFAAYPFESLSIVAHSMGGLVTRSACHYALEAGLTWPRRVSQVFLLGVPSRGADLERLANITAFTLRALWNPWTMLIGAAISLRSAGIKDLRHGFVLDEDWRHLDLDRPAASVPSPARFPEQAECYVLYGTLSDAQPTAEEAPEGERGRRADEPTRLADTLGAAFGDGLVRPASAKGQSLDPRARQRIDPTGVAHFPRTGHLALMTDPGVLRQLSSWWR
ncbi:PGAP1-like protein [Plesiocystis pacifica SIR-1]|uniref:PGAP1-like protein n=1 Tax=Plesiocystis pacifica SIR-1 TaxID=391625 RepID=A6FY80_9BACT|nr:alpha/beta hydrolase [Plesiocystis pacifica]EDM81459.1 PGAP1-like protein [Plesiocystis pacifica SIR-1]